MGISSTPPMPSSHFAVPTPRYPVSSVQYLCPLARTPANTLKFKNKSIAPIDELWLHVMLSAIGETLESSPTDGEVMGVVVNVRKGFYRIGLWTKTVGEERKSKDKSKDADGKGEKGEGKSGEGKKEVLMGIGKRLKEVMGLGAGEQLEFSGHSDAAHAGSTRAKAKFVC